MEKRVIAGFLLFLALAPWPYLYYQLVRWIVCGVGCYVAFQAHRMGAKWVVWGLGIIALLFNPLVVFRFEREMWQILDVVAGVFFVLGAALVKRVKTD